MATNLVFKKIGDFYELKGEVAREVGKKLGLTVTSGRISGEPMIGIPYHSFNKLKDELERDGYDVEVEQDKKRPRI